MQKLIVSTRNRHTMRNNELLKTNRKLKKVHLNIIITVVVYVV